jgi:hypothetical protein
MSAKILIAAAALVLAGCEDMPASRAPAHDEPVLTGSTMSNRELDDVHRRLIAWCSGLGGGEAGRIPVYHEGYMTCAIQHGEPLQTTVLFLSLSPKGGGVSVFWTASGPDVPENVGAQIADAVM